MQLVKKIILFIVLFIGIISFTKIWIELLQTHTWLPWIALGAGIVFLVLRWLKRSNSYYLPTTGIVWMLYFIYEAAVTWQYIPANPQDDYRGDLYILFPLLFMLSIISLYDFIKAKKRQTLSESSNFCIICKLQKRPSSRRFYLHHNYSYDIVSLVFGKEVLYK